MKIEGLNKLIKEVEEQENKKQVHNGFDEFGYKLHYEYVLAMNDCLQENRTEEEIERLVEASELCEYNNYVFEVVMDEDVLKYRTIDEQIRLMLTLKFCDYNQRAYQIAVDEAVIEYRTAEEQQSLMIACEDRAELYEIATLIDILEITTGEEQINLMKTLKLCDYSKLSYKIATDNDVLKYRMIDEIVRLMVACENSYDLYDIAVDEAVLEYRNAGEQIKLMEVLKEYSYDDNAYSIVIDEETLKNMTCEEQINKIINSVDKKENTQMKKSKVKQKLPKTNRVYG